MIIKDSILDAAQSLFAQFGLKKVTTDDIARKAHVSKATIYKLYKNKSEIFDKVVRLEAEKLIQEIGDAVAKEKTIKGKLKAHLMTHIGRIQDFVNFYRVTQETWGEFWKYIARVRIWFLFEEEKIVRRILTEGIKSGELYVKEVNLAARIMVVSLTSLEYQWALKGNDVSISGYIDMMLEMMVEGIKKR